MVTTSLCRLLGIEVPIVQAPIGNGAPGRLPDGSPAASAGG
jgi:hypothetical protein